MISARNIALPLLSGDGKQLFFVGREDFTQQNPDVSAEIFLLRTDVANPLLTLLQLTDFPPLEFSANPFDVPSADSGSRTQPGRLEAGFPVACQPAGNRRGSG